MKELSKAIATIAIWGGAALLSYLFNSFGILSGGGAAWIVVGIVLLTACIWTT